MCSKYHITLINDFCRKLKLKLSLKNVTCGHVMFNYCLL